MSVSNVRSRLGVTRFMHFQKDEAEHEHITEFYLVNQTSKSSNVYNIVLTVLFVKCWPNSFSGESDPECNIQPG